MVVVKVVDNGVGGGGVEGGDGGGACPHCPSVRRTMPTSREARM